MQKVDIVLEEYFPMKVIFTKDDELVEYKSFIKGNKSLLELAVGKNTKLIKRMTLTLSEEYSMSDDLLDINDYYDEEILLDSGRTECNVFSTIVYRNAVKMVLSNKNSIKFIKVDRVYFGFSDEEELVEICVLDMSDAELAHTRRELELQ